MCTGPDYFVKRYYMMTVTYAPVGMMQADNKVTHNSYYYTVLRLRMHHHNLFGVTGFTVGCPNAWYIVVISWTSLLKDK